MFARHLKVQSDCSESRLRDVDKLWIHDVHLLALKICHGIDASSTNTTFQTQNALWVNHRGTLKQDRVASSLTYTRMVDRGTLQNPL